MTGDCTERQAPIPHVGSWARRVAIIRSGPLFRDADLRKGRFVFCAQWVLALLLPRWFLIASGGRRRAGLAQRAGHRCQRRLAIIRLPVTLADPLKRGAERRAGVVLSETLALWPAILRSGSWGWPSRGPCVEGRQRRRRTPGLADLAVGLSCTVVAAADLLTDLAGLDKTLMSIEAVLDPAGKRVEIAELQEQASAPDLWNDQENAQRVTSKLSALQAEVDRLAALRQRVDDLAVLIELGQEEDDADTLAEAGRELGRLATDVQGLEVRTLLNGDYDDRDAVVTIRSEAGGVDAADFAEMLLRMYLRWAERHGYPADVYDTSYAEEAGIKSATFTVRAPFAYGTLSVEQGTHRLVRISPFDNQGRRQTSFAGVEVLPVTEEADHIEIPEADIRVDVFRSSGPGGQSVNTTDSAVRLTHLPTGIVVSCQNEKSQLQNKVAAMKVLQSRLLEKARRDREAELNALKSDAGNSWGSQMRSYVLHPYQMVKDLRTDYEVGSPDAVFDGDLDGFIDAGIRWRRQQGER